MQLSAECGHGWWLLRKVIIAIAVIAVELPDERRDLVQAIPQTAPNREQIRSKLLQPLKGSKKSRQLSAKSLRHLPATVHISVSPLIRAISN